MLTFSANPSFQTEIRFTGKKQKKKKEVTVIFEEQHKTEQKWYLDLTAVIGYDEAKQGDGGQTDDRLDGQRVDGAL